MAWVDTPSDTFVARHDARDADDAERVLAQLEFARTRLEERFETRPGELEVVLHSSPAQLDAAQPWVPVARRLTAPAARRYVVGWAGPRELHVLCPRLLAHRASNVEGSLEMLMLAPSALPNGGGLGGEAAARPRGPPPRALGRGGPPRAPPAGLALADVPVVALGLARGGRRAVAERPDPPRAAGDRAPAAGRADAD